MSKILDYEEWEDTYGFELLEELQKWIDLAPCYVDDSMIDNIVATTMDIEYNRYLQDYDSFMYEQYKDERIEDAIS